MDDKEFRRAKFRLAASAIALGFIIGLGVGLAVAYHTIERTVVIPLPQGIRT